MKPQTSKNIRLGIMVIAGTVLLVVALYMIGDKRNLFSSTFTINAYFRDVSGLMVGNNVRFVGIDIGTVTDISIENDTAVRVELSIESDARQYIKQNAVASIGTDGLMGNRLVNITPVGLPAPLVNEGDVLASSSPLDANEAIRVLSDSNDDIAAIARNLRIFTEGMNQPGSVWQLLSDSTTATSIQQALSSIALASHYAANVTLELNTIMNDIRAGKGGLGALIYDTTFVSGLNQSVNNVLSTSDSLLLFSGEMLVFSDQVINSEGAMKTLIADSAFDANLEQSMEHIRVISENLEEATEAVQHSFLLRRYYKKKEKQRKQGAPHLD